MSKSKRRQKKDKQAERDCALVAELFGLCCNRCEDMLGSIVGNMPVGWFVGVRKRLFDRSALLTEATVEDALSCFRPVVLKTIANNLSLSQASRFNGHDALFYIKGLEVLWQTAFSALKRTLTAPKCLIVSEHAMVKALVEIEYLYRNGEKRYSCEDVRESFQTFLKTLPDLATALAQYDYKNPLGGIGSRAVRGEREKQGMAKTPSEPTARKGCPQSLEYTVREKRRNDGLRCLMSDDNYEEILKAIKNTAMTWERTPNSYRHMGEEALRDALLASLNGLFPGRANGETFRKNGKTDISIENEDRTAFVAECKMWTGESAVPKALVQLDSYLTWRDRKTALIYFVNRKDFLAIIDKIQAVLNKQRNLQSVQSLDRNEFVCQMSSTRTPGHIINIRILLFNLHSDEDKKGASK